MRKKLIITENQLLLINNILKEDSNHTITMVKMVADYLSKYYSKSSGTYKDNGTYHNTPMLTNKIDDELISPKNLLRHLKEKFKLSPEFLGQVLRDWYDGKLDNGFLLSQNVSPNK